MVQPLTYLKETASQTAGPFVHIGLIPKQAGFEIFATDFTNVIAGDGERIRIEGQVIDGTGAPLKDVLLECWQADKDGSYDNPDFRGWARTGSDFDSGEWAFETIKPGPVAAPDGRLMAPHISLWIVARGINTGLHTRLYFADEAAANAADPVMARIEHAARRQTLIARRRDGGAKPVYRFDIVLQGENETVFFDV